MPKSSNRDRILKAGLEVMYREGYGGAGVRDIVAEASAPQGSFTNHFGSKEDFAREVLDLYFVDLKRLVAEGLDDANRRPRERLRRYLDLITDRLVGAAFTHGCLIGDLRSRGRARKRNAADAAGRKIFAEWRSPFAACIAEGPGDGRDPPRLSRLRTRRTSSYRPGTVAILRMKVERNAEPLERFKHIVFASVFKGRYP